jgi:hypothetical protein
MVSAAVFNFWLCTIEIRNFLSSEYQIGFQTGNVYASSVLSTQLVELVQGQLIAKTQDPETIKLILETCKPENLFSVTSLNDFYKEKGKKNQPSTVSH